MDRASAREGRSSFAFLEAFVPPLVRRGLARRGPLVRAYGERFPAALLLADVSGFSTLAERFATRGARGAEDLKDLLNLLFGRLVDLVDAHGGEVLKFAGDAALALWTEDGTDEITAARHAAQCAFAAQEALDGIQAADGVRLRLRVGLGAGEVWAGSVGGAADRWELVLAGKPLEQAAAAMTLARPGEIVASAPLWSRVAPYAATRGLANGAALLERLLLPLPPSPAEPVVLPPETEPLLRAYVPRAVQARLDAGQTEWLAEFRRASVLFVKLDGLDYAAPDVLDRLQPAVLAVQRAVHRYGGSVNQLLADDKGTVVVCGWGLALHVHEDDAARAVRAALEMRQELEACGIRGSFGLATGEIFTGLRGSPRRAEYAMIGSVVNLAARLMQAADGDILCDTGTAEAARKRIEFTALAALQVKGWDKPVEVYRPHAAIREAAAAAPLGIVGRAVERRALEQRLAAAAGDDGSVVILEGEAGIGKSRLVADLVERAHAQGVRLLVALGDAVERSAPYHPWRALFDQLLGLESLTGPGERESRILELLEPSPRLAPFAPLLNPVLHLSFPETERTRSVTAIGRARFTQDLLVELFRGATEGAPAALVLEDAHWFDSASWALAEGLCRELQQLFALIATRPFSEEEQPPELRRLRQSERAVWLRLEAFSAEEAGELVCRRLGAKALDEPVARLIFEKTEGHPYFTEELSYALRDRELVRIEDGVCRFATAAAARESLAFPNTIQAVITSRIDHLAPAQQLTLKVASVLGRTFDLISLRAIHPIATDQDELPLHLEALASRDLAHLVSSEPAPTYLFKHSITQEVSYGLLPFAQRRQLHQAVAQWYERERDDLSPWYALLAHHWSKAEVDERSVFYLDKAGEQAFGRYGNEEATRFFGEALATDLRIGASVLAGEPVRLPGRRAISAREARRIRWERLLGDAQMNLGNLPEGWAHHEHALRLLGLDLPTTSAGWVSGCALQILIQVAHRLFPWGLRRLNEPAATLLREAVRAYTRIGGKAYSLHRDTVLLYGLAAGLNLAERLGPIPELATAYADMGNILGLIPLHTLARSFGSRARQLAYQLGDAATLSRVLGRSSIYRTAVGDWSACADLETAMELAEQIGDPFHWEECASVRARAANLQGDFRRAVKLGGEVYSRAVASATESHETWGISAQAWGLLHLGEIDRALDLAMLGGQVRTSAGYLDRSTKVDLLGIRALGYLQRGELDAARQAVDAQVEEIALLRQRHHRSLGLSAGAETYIRLWEIEGSASRPDIGAKAHVSCRALDRCCRINPPVRAQSFLWRGCIAWLEGRHDAAHGLWRRCLAEADRFALPYEAARAQYEIGRHLGLADPERRAHLVRAEESFRRMGAETDLSRVEAALRAG